MEEFVSTVEVFLLAWVVISIIIALAAARLGKYGLLFGLGLGFITANVVILERPYGVAVIAVEAFVVVAVGILYLLATGKRTYESDRFGRSDEQGLGILLNPETPVERAIKAAGEAQIGIINAQTQLAGAETRRLIAEARMWAQQTEFERLQLDLPKGGKTCSGKS